MRRRALSPHNTFSALLLVLMVAVPARQGASQPFGQPDAGDGDVQFDLSWSEQRLDVVITRPVVDAMRSPTAVSRTQTLIRRDAEPLLVGVLLQLQFDESATLAERPIPDLSEQMSAIARRAVAIDAGSDSELRNASVTFRIDLATDVAATLHPGDEPERIPGRLGWIATTEYTGLIIDARGMLSVFGANRTDELRPALFPKLHYLDETNRELHLLFDATMAEPAQIARHGMVLYHDDPLARAVQERVGENPLRVLAAALFGETPVDPVLLLEDAAELMADANHSLLREGRIVIILPSQRL